MNSPGYPGSMGCALVIGYGNALRRDDGVGLAVARRLVGTAGVSVIEAFQILPEPIEAAAAADVIVLVDASIDLAPGEVRSEPSHPSAAGPAAGGLHEISPAGLLAAVSSLYGNRPNAWLVTIGAADLDLGEHLSPEVEAAVERAVEVVATLLQSG